VKELRHVGVKCMPKNQFAHDVHHVILVACLKSHKFDKLHDTLILSNSCTKIMLK